MAGVVDVRDLDALTKLVTDGVAQLGHLDVVVANAGICTMQSWDEIVPAVWNEVIGINLTGTWNTCAASIPHLIDAGGGSLILISSVAGLKGQPLRRSNFNKVINWKEVTAAIGVPQLHLHDLRHTYASVLASAGFSLPLIGALLGHTQAATTHRYAHLLDDPLRVATERAGLIVTGKGVGDKPAAEVIEINRR